MLWKAALLLTSASSDCWGWKTRWLNFTSFAVAEKRWRRWREQEEEAFLSNSFVPPLTLLPFPVSPHVSQKKVYVWKCCRPSNVLSCMKVKRRPSHLHPHPECQARMTVEKTITLKKYLAPVGLQGPQLIILQSCVWKGSDHDLRSVWFLFLREHFPGIYWGAEGKKKHANYCVGGLWRARARPKCRQSYWILIRWSRLKLPL